MIRPKSTHKPLGDIAIHKRWSTVEEALFAKLCIERSLKEEAYLAAYLVCCFCVFILLVSSSLSHSPHRFGHQFGYYQDIPGTLRYDTRATSLEEGLRYWRLCVLSKSSSKAWFPCLPTNVKKHCSEAYKAWCTKVYGTFPNENIACVINSKSIKITLKYKKNEDKQVDGGENNPPMCLFLLLWSSIILKLQLRRQVKEKSFVDTTTPATVSVFEGDLFKNQKELLKSLWNDLLVKISNTLVDFISSIEDDVYLILESMKSFHKFDVSKVDESLNMFFLSKLVLMTKRDPYLLRIFPKSS
ncbi:hypothetical protein Sango_2873600 [Sesamum angolense]|uniref:Uncharacterized protein n=1 Tax=Sesamum angolense TaxID=2727404 RepID=A0AAE1T772_9LAMI|nr:hypothetical protein Sango_2873600 [Sesamum angolense]